MRITIEKVYVIGISVNYYGRALIASHIFWQKPDYHYAFLRMVFSPRPENARVWILTKHLELKRPLKFPGVFIFEVLVFVGLSDVVQCAGDFLEILNSLSVVLLTISVSRILAD